MTEFIQSQSSAHPVLTFSIRIYNYPTLSVSPFIMFCFSGVVLPQPTIHSFGYPMYILTPRSRQGFLTPFPHPLARARNDGFGRECALAWSIRCLCLYYGETSVILAIPSISKGVNSRGIFTSLPDYLRKSEGSFNYSGFQSKYIKRYVDEKLDHLESAFKPRDQRKIDFLRLTEEMS
ncbi:unnamed protein product [Allacma fusca]|uniref:Uncharacterized protein n=1 Tax=Allacma fusca TaxID=39272 RepID=A0A8J2J5H5_9HEXA|nr:unnamed protein product [Allacma fusca]